MQKFIDRRGRIWIVDIDNTTLLRVKALTDVRLLDAIDCVLVTRLSIAPLLLNEVLSAICKPQANQQDVDDKAFAKGQAGGSIDKRCNALVDASVAYFPESRRRLLRKAADKQKMIETRGLAAIEQRLDDPNLVDRIVEDLERKLAVPSLSDSSSDSPASSESTPGPLTFRQLVQMAEAKRQHDWRRTHKVCHVCQLVRDWRLWTTVRGRNLNVFISAKKLS